MCEILLIVYMQGNNRTEQNLMCKDFCSILK